jgi:hypothetical protein
LGKEGGSHVIEGCRFAELAVCELEAGIADKLGVGLKLCALVSGHALLDLCLVSIPDGRVPCFAEVPYALHGGLVGARHLSEAALLLLRARRPVFLSTLSAAHAVPRRDAAGYTASPPLAATFTGSTVTNANGNLQTGRVFT